MLLYKYTKAKWGMAILRELRLKVSPPKEFNDPFEFTPSTTNPIESADCEKLAKLNDYLHQQGCAESSVESLQKVLPVLKQDNPIIRNFPLELANFDMAARAESSAYFGVLCLSESRADVRMWAHYGGENCGVAVGLDFDNEASGIDGVVGFDKVIYDNRRPPLNPLLSEGEEFHAQMLKMAMTKSTAWETEREYRMIIRLEDLQKEERGQCGHQIFDYFIHIRPETIREVAMGCFISPRDERAIRAVLEAKLPHVKLMKMRRHETEFELVAVSTD